MSESAKATSSPRAWPQADDHRVELAGAAERAARPHRSTRAALPGCAAMAARTRGSAGSSSSSRTKMVSSRPGSRGRRPWRGSRPRPESSPRIGPDHGDAGYATSSGGAAAGPSARRKRPCAASTSIKRAIPTSSKTVMLPLVGCSGEARAVGRRSALRLGRQGHGAEHPVDRRHATPLQRRAQPQEGLGRPRRASST